LKNWRAGTFAKVVDRKERLCSTDVAGNEQEKGSIPMALRSHSRYATCLDNLNLTG
jgi:hypothetical protein